MLDSKINLLRLSFNETFWIILYILLGGIWNTYYLNWDMTTYYQNQIYVLMFKIRSNKMGLCNRGLTSKSTKLPFTNQNILQDEEQI